MTSGPSFAEKSNITSAFAIDREKPYEETLRKKIAKHISSSSSALDSKSSITDLQKSKFVHSNNQCTHEAVKVLVYSND